MLNSSPREKIQTCALQHDFFSSYLPIDEKVKELCITQKWLIMGFF